MWPLHQNRKFKSWLTFSSKVSVSSTLPNLENRAPVKLKFKTSAERADVAKRTYANVGRPWTVMSMNPSSNLSCSRISQEPSPNRR